MKEILVIGGTGAQGLPVVNGACARPSLSRASARPDLIFFSRAALSSSKHFTVRVLTRNTNSSRAQQLVKLPNVTLVEGRQDNQKDLHKAFHGVYGHG